MKIERLYTLSQFVEYLRNEMFKIGTEESWNSTIKYKDRIKQSVTKEMFVNEIEKPTSIDMSREIFKPIVSYENIYEVSNYGNVKSLERVVICNKGHRALESIILKPGIDTSGYYIVGLLKNKKQSTRRIHQLVAESFLGHTPNGMNDLIDHKDSDRKNNYADNLRIVNIRQNNSDRITRKNNYVGVYKSGKKYKAVIMTDGKSKHLGYFDTEGAAKLTYELELKEINEKKVIFYYDKIEKGDNLDIYIGKYIITFYDDGQISLSIDKCKYIFIETLEDLAYYTNGELKLKNFEI